MTRSAGRSPVRAVAIGVCAVLVAVLFGAVVRQSWSDAKASADVVEAEYEGTTMLHGMTSLLSALVEAQSTAVRGERVDPATVRKALAALTEPNGEYSATLQTDQRLADLTSQIESAFARADAGRAAYDTYSSLVSLTVDLMRRIGDTSHLIHDADLDSYYLMDAAIVRLPDAVVYAGRATDLVTMAGGKALTGEDQVRAAVARFGVSYDAEQVSSGLTKSVDFTAKSDLGSNVAERLDTFKAAADAFAPPTMLAELATTVDAATLAANARRVYAAATSLAHLLLSELQALLTARAQKVAAQQRFTLLAAAVAAIIGVATLWLAVAVRPRRRSAARPFGGPPQDLPVGSLAYPRDLLESEQRAHAGRAREQMRDPMRGSGNAF